MKTFEEAIEHMRSISHEHGNAPNVVGWGESIVASRSAMSLVETLFNRIVSLPERSEAFSKDEQEQAEYGKRGLFLAIIAAIGYGIQIGIEMEKP